jgi:hypothetical protein
MRGQRGGEGKKLKSEISEHIGKKNIFLGI